MRLAVGLAGRDRRLRWILVGGVGIALLVLAAACGGGGDDDASDGLSGATAEITMITGAKFDRDELRVPAGEEVTIRADNRDGSIPHNLSIYESAQALSDGETPIVFTEICNAPCVRDLSVTLDPGSYYFICEVHPFMAGNLIAEVAS